MTETLMGLIIGNSALGIAMIMVMITIAVSGCGEECYDIWIILTGGINR